MERKLASIRQVSEISPIEGADLIEVATVDGWKLVTKKGEYKPGDLAIYCEIDSLLPIREEFEFLRKSSYKKLSDGTEGFRLKTIKLRGQISQGLLLPISILPNQVVSSTSYGDLIGTDVTEVIGIVKYEPPIPANLAGKIKGFFPSFIRKTDEERIQNMPDIISKLKGEEFYVTEKLDGSSATYYFNNNEFGVCSRNLELLEEDSNTFWKVAREMDIENKLKSLNKNICIQGELIGEGIQKNPYKIKGQTVKFYNAFNIDKYEYLSFEEFVCLIKELKFETVPIIDTAYILPETVGEILKYSEGKSNLNSNTEREGLVFRTKDVNRTSFKAISNIFLLGEKD